MKRNWIVIAIMLFVALAPLAVSAEDEKKSDEEETQVAASSASDEASSKAKVLEYKLLDRVTISGSPSRTKEIPGSVQQVTLTQLQHENQAFDDIHRVMFRLPGVNVTEEDGYGLRPNIGMRATGTDRSANITLMEDGILAAPAPYAAPAAYYFPVTGRMQGVEVRKGSSQIKYGPRTNGGALNLLSTSVPNNLAVRANVAGGSQSTRKAYVSYGDQWKTLGWMLETYQIATDGFKQLDTGGNTGFEVSDYVGKVRYSTGIDANTYQEIVFKAGYKEEASNETYLGLTDEDFAANPYRRYAGSQKDVMNNDHRLYQLRHFAVPADHMDITTTVYRTEFWRNWYKLDKVNGSSIADVLDDPESYSTEYAYLTGDSASDNDALRVKANNRDYYTMGIESIMGLDFKFAGAHDVEIGIRAHVDEEDRHQWSDGYRMELGGAMVRTTAGTPGFSGGGDNRVNEARAIAGFLQDHIRAGRFIVSPGVRVESIRTERKQYATGDPDRKGDPVTTNNSTDVVLPGIGVNFRVTRALSVFAGTHRGFAPPGPGSPDEVQPELSVNFETGFRLGTRVFSANALAFFNDYSNMIGKDTFSSGGDGSGDQFNAGAVNAWGVEAGASLDPGVGSTRFPMNMSYTYAVAEFQSSFLSGYGPWGAVEKGDHVPYIPEHQLSGSIAIERPKWRLGTFANYTSEMRTEAGQGPIPPSQSTDARLLIDGSAEYNIVRGTTAFLSVQNITDEAYIVARRPSGVRPGLPRTIIAGLRFGL